MHIPENATVSYIGDERNGLVIGDRGRVISSSGSASHVRWVTGARTGDVVLLSNDALVAPTRTTASIDDSLDDGLLVTVAARQAYDEGGPDALLSAMSEGGHLAVFASLIEEAIESVSSKIRNDPSVNVVLASLDPTEREEFVEHAASVLLRDALEPEDGE